MAQIADREQSCLLIIIIITRNLYKFRKQTQSRRLLHISKTHDQHLEACWRAEEAFAPARQGTILTPIESSALLPIPQW